MCQTLFHESRGKNNDISERIILSLLKTSRIPGADIYWCITHTMIAYNYYYITTRLTVARSDSRYDHQS